MCGIVGLMARNTVNDKQLKNLVHLLVLDQMRGEHATGLAKIDTKKNEVKVLKKAVDAIDFLSQEETKEFLNKDRTNLYIGHNRYATMGSRDDKGAHPFQKDHITMVHNGTVDRWAMRDLTSFSDPDVTVDSEMVCHTIAEKGIDEAVKLFSGAFSLVWWNEKERSLNFLRNDKRPMFISHGPDDTTLWASEMNFLILLLSRQDKVTKEHHPYATEVNTLYTWRYDDKGALLNKGRPFVRPLAIKEIPSPYAADDWGGYMGHGVRYTGHGSNYGIERINDLLKTWGLNVKEGQKMSFTCSHLVRNNERDRTCSVFGFVENEKGEKISVRSFNTPLNQIIPGFNEEILKDLTLRVSMDQLREHNVRPLFHATVDNAYRVSEPDGNGIYQNFPRVIVDTVWTEDSRKPAIKAAVTPSKVEEGRIKWPFKVDGWIFRTAQDFMDITSQGCSCCGEIPNVFDRRNHRMFVYASTGGRRATKQDAEFVCGQCVIEDETNRGNK